MSAPMQVLRQARLTQAPKPNVQRRFLNMQPTRRAMRPVPVSTDAQYKLDIANNCIERRAQRYVSRLDYGRNSLVGSMSSNRTQRILSLSASEHSRRFLQS